MPGISANGGKGPGKEHGKVYSAAPAALRGHADHRVHGGVHAASVYAAQRLFPPGNDQGNGRGHADGVPEEFRAAGPSIRAAVAVRAKPFARVPPSCGRLLVLSMASEFLDVALWMMVFLLINKLVKQQ